MASKPSLTALVALGAMIALVACGGCEPVTSAESIYRDTDTAPPPAIADPFLEPGAPAAEYLTVSPLLTPGPAEPEKPPEPPFQRANVVLKPPGFDVWIDGHKAEVAPESRSAHIAPLVATEPMVRFELAERMGEVRSVVIQIYRVKADRLDPASGMALKEPGEPLVLVPRRDIFLPRPGGRVVIRHISSGAVWPWFVLQPDARYEIQFVIGCNREADALSVRVHTAAKGVKPGPGPTTQPDQPDDSPRLPEGVIIPGRT